MLLEQSGDDVNPPSGENVSTSRASLVDHRPTPKTVALRYGRGHECELEFIDWASVFGFIMRDGVTAVRDGDRIILIDAHFAQQIWGRA